MSKPLTETTAEKAALHDTAAPSLAHRRELAHRLSGGLEVTLYWNADDNSTSVEVFDVATEARFRFAVAPQGALDAFNHPFVHVQTTFDDAAFARDLRA